jgi:hypothetical protein
MIWYGVTRQAGTSPSGFSDASPSRASVLVVLSEAEQAEVQAALSTVDHSGIRGSSAWLAVMVIFRRELPRTNVRGFEP